MSVDLEPMLRRLEALAPHFGRAAADLEAMVTRARSQDYRGVMQNARLVLETILRSLVSEELKQTPGKAMLEELVSKFRQKSNAGIVPPNILAHMGTVQAWGNLSVHDHAGSLDETAVRVGREEVVASLNSMVAILTWYAERKGLSGPDLLGEQAAAGRLVPGRVIGGRYRLEARLASGGMGEVFRATHVELKRPLALKVMRRELSGDPEFVERFRREAITASRLGHPHIVDIIDSGSEDGQFYFVMEFLDGKPLSSLIDRGPVALPLALDIVTQIAQALEVAHRAGVVHRDLKPDNVIVLERAGAPFVKLVDFGVAKVVTPLDGKLTSTGVIVGTPQYIAPEQAAGLPVDARADVYTLGLILFELLTGKPPLVGETPALVMNAHISQAAPPLPATFPAPLRTLVARMLAKSPGDRPQSMTEVLRELSRVPRTPARRWPRALAVAGASAALLGLGVVALTHRASATAATAGPTPSAPGPSVPLPPPTLPAPPALTVPAPASAPGVEPDPAAPATVAQTVVSPLAADAGVVPHRTTRRPKQPPKQPPKATAPTAAPPLLQPGDEL